MGLKYKYYSQQPNWGTRIAAYSGFVMTGFFVLVAGTCLLLTLYQYFAGPSYTPAAEQLHHANLRGIYQGIMHYHEKHGVAPEHVKQLVRDDQLPALIFIDPYDITLVRQTRQQVKAYHEKHPRKLALEWEAAYAKQHLHYRIDFEKFRDMKALSHEVIVAYALWDDPPGANILLGDGHAMWVDEAHFLEMLRAADQD